MPRVSRHWHLATALILASVLAWLAGCGGSSAPTTNSASKGTASEALEATKQAAANASSVTIHATGHQVRGGSLTLDLQLNRQGGKGKIAFLGTEFEVIRVGQDLYVKGSTALYTQLGIKKQVPHDTWVKLPAQNSLAAITSLAGETARIISPSGPVTKGATTTVDSQPVLELKTEGKLYKGRLYIKTTGQAYPIKLEKQGRETAQITFTDWDQPVTITAPAKTIPAAG